MRKRTIILARNDVKRFPTKVGDALLHLANDHDVKFRLMDGGHIRFYPKDGVSRPFKVSANRSEEASLHFIEDFTTANHLEEP